MNPPASHSSARSKSHEYIYDPFQWQAVLAPQQRGHVDRGASGGRAHCICRLGHAAFTWPTAKGPRGESVDLRHIAKRYRKSSNFSTQLIDTHRETAWFSAINAKQGVMLAYAWNRSDYPWLGNWEENYSRSGAPWRGKSQTRGMEFGNAPFPESLRSAVTRGSFLGEPTFRWLPARGMLSFKYAIIMLPVARNVKAVNDIRPSANGDEVDLVTRGAETWAPHV